MARGHPCRSSIPCVGVVDPPRKGLAVTAGSLLDSVLAMPSTALAMNFYLAESDREGDFRTSAAERRDRLLAHLHRVDGGDLVIVGEAPGWKGARQSGVPFTSANTVELEGSSEGSATIVHGMLSRLGISDRTLLWNAFPLHPHHAGSPRTNRTPTKAELDSGLVPLRLAVAGRRIICVGHPARKSVARLLGIEVPGVRDASATSSAIAVRHPANGGATEFRSGLAAVGDLWDL
ncbi:uracil-DNA glycosylase [Microbacterium luticocti]|uniref:uracil-DNA glycosylase n=1 Tax=Microbacterium luticocti TaxID=451764 RepID=UPI0012EB4E15